LLICMTLYMHTSRARSSTGCRACAREELAQPRLEPLYQHRVGAPRGVVEVDELERVCRQVEQLAHVGLVGPRMGRHRTPRSRDELLTLDEPRTDCPLTLPSAPPPHEETNNDNEAKHNCCEKGEPSRR
jgi:hypothetical protein